MKKSLMIALLASVFCVMVGCQDRGAVAELDEFRALAALEEQNKYVVKLYIDALNEGNFEAFKELLSDDYGIFSPYGYPEPTSREKFIKNMEEARKAFSEFIWDIDDMIASGDKVICRVMVRGTVKEGVPGLPEGEKKFEIGLITIIRLQDGRIVEEWQEDDQLRFARQMGMELKPKETDDHP